MYAAMSPLLDNKPPSETSAGMKGRCAKAASSMQVDVTSTTSLHDRLRRRPFLEADRENFVVVEGQAGRITVMSTVTVSPGSRVPDAGSMDSGASPRSQRTVLR
jgi:hypothetical protein